MSTQQLISNTIPALSPSDTIGKALALFDEQKVTHLPVVAEDEYVALVSEDALLEAVDDNIPMSDSGLLSFRPAMSALSHPFEAFSIMHDARLDVLPVTDAEQKYLGCITRETLLDYFALNSGLNNPGGMIVLDILPRNYSLYEIARICENEDMSILGMWMNNTDHGTLRVTLKLNRQVLDAVVASFTRHNYQVLAVYGRESDKEDIMSNYNLLMNYINM